VKTFATWEEARAFAEAEVARSGLACGIEREGFDPYSPPMKSSPYTRWVVRYLPQKKNRYGYDALCEAVEPTPRRAFVRIGPIRIPIAPA
jgi:hypothetical protein